MVMRTHITRLEAGIAAAVRGNLFYHDDYGPSIPLEALDAFTGQGNRLGGE